MPELELIQSIVQNVGMWIIGFVLFFQERKAHNETKDRYFDDLREMAGIKARLRPNVQSVQDKPE